MRYFLASVIFCCAAIPAYAQQPASTYAPITLNEQDWTKLQTYLGDQPAKFSNPVIGFLNQMEQVAITKAAAEAKAKADAAKLPLKPSPKSK